MVYSLLFVTGLWFPEIGRLSSSNLPRNRNMAVGTIELAQDIDQACGWVASSFDLVLAVDKLILLNFVSQSMAYASQST